MVFQKSPPKPTQSELKLFYRQMCGSEGLLIPAESPQHRKLKQDIIACTRKQRSYTCLNIPVPYNCELIEKHPEGFLVQINEIPKHSKIHKAAALMKTTANAKIILP